MNESRSEDSVENSQLMYVLYVCRSQGSQYQGIGSKQHRVLNTRVRALCDIDPRSRTNGWEKHDSSLIMDKQIAGRKRRVPTDGAITDSPSGETPDWIEFETGRWFRNIFESLLLHRLVCPSARKPFIKANTENIGVNDDVRTGDGVDSGSRSRGDAAHSGPTKSVNDFGEQSLESNASELATDAKASYAEEFACRSPPRVDGYSRCLLMSSQLSRQ